MVTIGIPFYNAESYLADAIRSVFAQTFTKWELLLVDDGSTDRSLEIARAVKDPRVRVISDGHNRGLPSRLNQISREAQFNFVARMDADDLMSPDRIAKQVSVFRDHPEVHLVTTGICSIDDNNQVVGLRVAKGKVPLNGRNLLLGRCPIVHAAILGRRDWFLRNPYDETLYRTEDYELWLRAYSRNDFSIMIMDEPLYYYREDGSVKAEKLAMAYKSHRDLYKTYGHLGFSEGERILLNVSSHLKTIIVRLLGAVRGEQILLRLRNRNVTDFMEGRRFEREIADVLSVPLPGESADA